MPPTGNAPVLLPGELNTDARARRAAIEFEARERRRHELAELVAIRNTPEQRIRVWERLHELSLPRMPNHPLIRTIAADTELTVADIRDEQRRRRTPPTKDIAEIPGKPPLV
jgi:hypothetical protein